MKRTFATFILTLACLSIFAQSFEGKVVYSNTFKSKNAGLTNEKLTAMMGNVMNYYIKGGAYKSESNGTFVQWQLYVNADNKLYTKVANSAVVTWADAATNDDLVLKTELHKDAADILGYKCDELILICKSGIQKYYFTSKLPVDAKLYAKHQYGNWYAYLQQANAVPLKMVIDNDQFTMESTATAVKPTKLNKAFFRLPANTKTVKGS